jgi:mannose-1-phosphate guanylyltransferase/mannose-6-phosphate isomerase
MRTVIPVILAGGTGTRLWPRSRSAFPKQFLDIGAPRALLVETVARLSADGRFMAPILASASEHGFLIAQALKADALPIQAILCEPLKRNTAPAIAAVACRVRDTVGPDAILCVMPADHIVRDPEILCGTLLKAADAAAHGKIVTIGITPNEAATGYGYIEAGEHIDGMKGVHDVVRFVEKPNRKTAEEFLASGKFLWNGGMFVARADTLIAEMQALCPDVLAAAQASVRAAQGDSVITLDKAEYEKSPSISFDYAVMERTKRAAVVPADFGWADVGSWSALWGIAEKDAAKNVLKGDVIAHDCTSTLIDSDSGLVVGLGLERMVVVHTRDATLVAPLDRAQDVGAIVETLKTSQRHEAVHHTRVHRPWGWYDSLSTAPGYQVKHLMIAPGEAISLQYHRHRSEHWVVQSGKATVTRDNELFELTPGQSTFIPIGAKHRLENTGTEPVHIIEVQLGDYLGEDDIVRFEDKYNRV